MRKKKWLLIVLMTIIGAVAMICGCTESKTPKIALDKTSLQMFVHDEATLTATVEDSDESVAWSTSDSSVAQVQDGKITAIGGGEAEITAAAGGVSAVCTVKVFSSFPVIETSPKALSIAPNGSGEIVASVKIGNETVSDVVFSFTSKDTAIATVSAEGIVSAVSKGTTQVEISASVFGRSVSETVDVVVEDQLEIRTNYNSLNLSLLSLNDTDLKTQTITAEFFVNDEKQTANFEFISGNEAVFTVTDEGEVSSEGIGEAELTVKAVAGDISVEKSLPVTVVKTTQTEFDILPEDYSSVMLTKNYLNNGTSQELAIAVEPYDKALDVVWTIENNGMGSLTVNETDPLKATYTVPEKDYYGGSVTISVRVEGSPATEFKIDMFVPVFTEQELVDINYHLDGYYMLMNDIVMQNKVEGIMPNTVNEPLTQEYKDVNGNPVWTYNKAVITQRTTLTSGEENWNGTFTGVFDGNGFTVSNLKIYFHHNGGLFGNNAGTIKNLNVIIEPYRTDGGGHLRSIRNQGGAICADNSGTVSNCSAKVTLIATQFNTTSGGGICGRLYQGGIIEDCFAEVEMVYVLETGSVDSTFKMGGIVGMTMAVEGSYTVDNCWFVYTGESEASKPYENNVNVIGSATPALANCGKINRDMSIPGNFPQDGFSSDIWDIEIQGEGENVKFTDFKLRKNCTFGVSVFLNQSSFELSLDVTPEYDLIAEVYGSDEKVVWASSNEGIVSVSQDGHITAVGAGTAQITATVGGATATCTVTVLEKALEISPDEYKEAILKGDTADLSVTLTPDTDADVEWKLTSGKGTLKVDETDSTKAIFTASDEKDYYGGAVTITVTVEGVYTVEFRLGVYVPIETEAELFGINEHLDGWYLLMNDIVLKNNMEGASEELDGEDGTKVFAYNKPVIGVQNNAFTGIFDGNGFTISNLKFKQLTDEYIGLFGGNNGTIRNLVLEHEIWKNSAGQNQGFRNKSGALVGLNRGTIENCYVKATVMGCQNNQWRASGAIAGYATGASKIVNCFVEVDWVDLFDGAGAIKSGGAVTGVKEGAFEPQNCWYRLTDETDTFVSLSGDDPAFAPEGNGKIDADNSVPEGFDASAFPSEIWNIVVEGEGASAKIKEIGLKRNCSYSSN